MIFYKKDTHKMCEARTRSHTTFATQLSTSSLYPISSAFLAATCIANQARLKESIANQARLKASIANQARLKTKTLSDIMTYYTIKDDQRDT
jgi:hypothetical protein